MRKKGNPDDAVLLAQLDTTAERAGTWHRLLEVAREFAEVAQHPDDFRWHPAQQRPDGVMVTGYPLYGERVERAREALVGVGAVTPLYHWGSHRPPTVPDGGQLAPADAVRLATAVVRGERFCDGCIGSAVEDGTLRAVLSSLAAWYGEQRAQHVTVRPEA
ncbi:DUF6508 domain-containing protein [Streptomyces mashuensis]|nr:DUF6508 domain-containing protein [Streptomyces mashuensis]